MDWRFVWLRYGRSTDDLSGSITSLNAQLIFNLDTAGRLKRLRLSRGCVVCESTQPVSRHNGEHQSNASRRRSMVERQRRLAAWLSSTSSVHTGWPLHTTESTHCVDTVPRRVDSEFVAQSDPHVRGRRGACYINHISHYVIDPSSSAGAWWRHGGRVDVTTMCQRVDWQWRRSWAPTISRVDTVRLQETPTTTLRQVEDASDRQSVLEQDIGEFRLVCTTHTHTHTHARARVYLTVLNRLSGRVLLDDKTFINATVLELLDFQVNQSPK